MAITWEIPERIDETTWFLKWTSSRTSPVSFRVFESGVKIYSTTSSDGNGELLVTVADGTFPFYEVLDADCQKAALAFPGQFTLHWRSVANATKYLIEEQLASVWTTRQTIFDDGSGTYSWKSRWLEDTTSHTFRVTASSAAGNAGTALTFAKLMVRRPDQPNVSVAKTSGALTLDIQSVA